MPQPVLSTSPLYTLDQATRQLHDAFYRYDVFEAFASSLPQLITGQALRGDGWQREFIDNTDLALRIYQDARTHGYLHDLSRWLSVYIRREDPNALLDHDRPDDPYFAFNFIANRLDCNDGEMGALARLRVGDSFVSTFRIPGARPEDPPVSVTVHPTITDQAVTDAQEFYHRVRGITNNDGLRDFILEILNSPDGVSPGLANGSATEAGFQRFLNMMVVYDGYYARHYDESADTFCCAVARSDLFGFESHMAHALCFELLRDASQPATGENDLGLSTVQNAIYAALRARALTLPAPPGRPAPGPGGGGDAPPPRMPVLPRAAFPTEPGNSEVLAALELPRREVT